MSKNTWNTKQIQPVYTKPVVIKKANLERVERNAVIPVIVTDEMLHKIKYLCKIIAKVEWSGVLFYSVKGSIKEPETLVCTLEDILPMDKGTASYTEYTFDDRITDYIMEDESRMEWRIGHIHSHNTMGVFFSGTDMSELNDNLEHHNYYLSFIVNNFMDFKAKIAYLAKIEGFEYIAEDENGDKYSEKINLSKEVMMLHKCDIQAPHQEIQVSKSFAEKVHKINTYVAPTVSYQSAFGKTSKPKSVDQSLDLLDWEPDGLTSLIDDFADGFTCYLLRLGENVGIGKDTVDTALDDLYTSIAENPTIIIEDISSNIDAVYEDLFLKFYNGTIGIYSEEHLVLLEEVIDILETYSPKYEGLNLLIEYLEGKHYEYDNNRKT